MSILDEAIREHLDLKRQHGADDSELRKLEDEAFGPPARPGIAPSDAPEAEAPTEHLAALQESPEPAPVEQPEAVEESVEAAPEPEPLAIEE